MRTVVRPKGVRRPYTPLYEALIGLIASTLIRLSNTLIDVLAMQLLVQPCNGEDNSYSFKASNGQKNCGASTQAWITHPAYTYTYICNYIHTYIHTCVKLQHFHITARSQNRGQISDPFGKYIHCANTVHVTLFLICAIPS